MVKISLILLPHLGLRLLSKLSAFTLHTQRNMAKMYQTQSDDTDDKDSLNSSFWSDGEREEVQVVSQGGAASRKESDREEKTEVKLCARSEESSEDESCGESDGGDSEEDDEEEEAKFELRQRFKTTGEEKPKISSCDESGEGSEGGYENSEESEDEEDGEEPEELQTESLNVGNSSKHSEESLEAAQEPDLCDRSQGCSEEGGDTEDEEDSEQLEEARISSETSVESRREGRHQVEPKLSVSDSSEGSSGEDDEEFENEDDGDEEEEEEEEGQIVQTKPEQKNPVTCGERKTSSEDEEARDCPDEADEEQTDSSEEEEKKSCESPAPSLMTSGYGTFRPEELEETGDLGGEQSDTAAEDGDSRGDLSEDGGGEDGHSLCSYGTMGVEPGDQGNEWRQAEPEAGKHELLQREVNVWQGSAVEEVLQSEEQQVGLEEEDGEKYKKIKSHVDTVLLEEEKEKGEDEERGDEHHLPDADGSTKSFSNQDIKFIDSKVNLSQMTFEEMCEGWEGNLRRSRGEEVPVFQQVYTHTSTNVQMVIVAPLQTRRAAWRISWMTCA